MKNILLILAIAFSSASFAQGNLQFNQVINSEYSGFVGSTGTNIGTIVVPAGKVLKIEDVSFSFILSSMPSIHYLTGSQVAIGNLTVFHNFNTQPVHFPIWLSEGSYTVFARVSSPITSTLSISAIEFNVVP